MTILFGNPENHGRAARAPAVRPSGFFGKAKTAFDADRRNFSVFGPDLLEKEVFAEQASAIERETGIKVSSPVDPSGDDYADLEVGFRERRHQLRRMGVLPREIEEIEKRARVAAFEERIEGMRANFPQATSLYDGDGREQRIRERAGAFEQRASQAGLGASLVGGVAASLTDPVTLTTAPIGFASKTVLGAVVREAVVNAAVEGVAQPILQSNRKRLGLDYGFSQGVFNVATAGIAGGVLGGTVKGGQRLFEGLTRSKIADVGRRSPDPQLRAGAAEIDREIEIDADVRGAAASPVDAAQKTAARKRMEAAQRVVEAGDDVDPRDVEIMEGRSGEIAARSIRDDVAVSPRGQSVNVRYVLVEADDLIASHDFSGTRNPAYPAELQPRDRGRAASSAQIANIAANLNPRLLDDAASLAEGAPVIGRDGVVESGNGRSLALMRAYERNMQSASTYKDYLISRGYPAEDMARPVLARMRLGDMSLDERASLARDANQRTTAAMSAPEQARADAAEIQAQDIALLDGDNPAAQKNADFVRRIAERIAGDADRGAMINKAGGLSPEGEARVRNAIFAYAYDDAQLIDRLLDGGDELRSLGGAMLDAAPEWARLKSGIDEGKVDPEVDIRPHLSEAANIVAEARKRGLAMAEFMKEFVAIDDMFTGGTHPLTLAMLRAFYASAKDPEAPVTFSRIASRADIAERIGFYAREARKVEIAPSLFERDGDAAGTILAAAQRRNRNGDAGGPPGLFDRGADGGDIAIIPDPEGGSGPPARAGAGDGADRLDAFDDPSSPRATTEIETTNNQLADELPDGDALVIGETLDDDGNVVARMATREEIEADLAADAAVVERMRGCIT